MVCSEMHHLPGLLEVVVAARREEEEKEEEEEALGKTGKMMYVQRKRWRCY
jgi:hypothetical protein